MSTELLRIKMDANAVRRACEDMAWRQTKFDPATVRANAHGPADADGSVEVVFFKKRVRKAKGAPNAG